MKFLNIDIPDDLRPLDGPFTTLQMITHHQEIQRWASQHIDVLIQHFCTERFIAGLSAYNAGDFSFGGFIHRMFKQKDHVLVPELGWQGSYAILNSISKTFFKANEIDRAALLARYPEFQGYYDPEAFGYDE